MGDPTADILALAVFLNGLLIFKTIYVCRSICLIFSISKHFQSWISLAGKRPTIYARRLSCPELHCLLFRAKLAWAISIILLLIAQFTPCIFIPG